MQVPLGRRQNGIERHGGPVPPSRVSGCRGPNGRIDGTTRGTSVPLQNRTNGRKTHKKAQFVHILIKNDAKQRPIVIFSIFRLCFISCVYLNCVKEMPPGTYVCIQRSELSVACLHNCFNYLVYVSFSGKNTKSSSLYMKILQGKAPILNVPNFECVKF